MNKKPISKKKLSQSKSPSTFHTSFTSISTIYKKPKSFLFAVGIIFLLACFLVFILSIGIVAKPVSKLSDYEDFLINEVKPSVQASDTLTDEQGARLLEFGGKLQHTLGLAVIATLLFLVIFSLLRTFREAYIWKKLFHLSISKRSLLKLFLLTLFVTVFMTTISFLILKTNHVPLFVVLEWFLFLILTEPLLYYFSGSLFLGKKVSQSGKVYGLLLLTGLGTRLLCLGVLLILIPVLAVLFFVGSVFGFLLFLVVLFILYVLREYYLLQVTHDLFIKEV